jgi:hypothetical protein
VLQQQCQCLVQRRRCTVVKRRRFHGFRNYAYRLYPGNATPSRRTRPEGVARRRQLPGAFTSTVVGGSASSSSDAS